MEPSEKPVLRDERAGAPAASRNEEINRALALALRKRDWLLETLEKHRRLAPGSDQVERRSGLSADEFLERYFAANRPVILSGEMDAWPALSLWRPDYLKAKVGAAIIQYQGDRNSGPNFDMYKDAHKRGMAFDRFIDEISVPGRNDGYITAYNCDANAKALAVLDADLRTMEPFLIPAPDQHKMKWIGPAGTFTSLHHDLTDNLLAQIVGAKRIKLVPAGQVAKLYNHRHVFSEISNLEDGAIDFSRYPLLKTVASIDVMLNPGEALFVPIGWWHQARSCDFSVSISYMNFVWGNSDYVGYPGLNLPK